jgi:hypothetical protein
MENALVCFVAVKVVKLTHAIARILEREKIRAGGGQLLERVLLFLLLFFFLLAGAGLLLRCVVAAATVGLWPPRTSHKASAALTTATAISGADCFLHGRGRQIKNIAKKRSSSGLTP